MIKVYNSLTRKKEEFKPLKGKKVKFFVCGPTLYDYPHLGHGKTYINYDVMASYLRSKGYEVFYLQNLTDIDDKIIKRAKEQDKKPASIAKKFEKEYYQSMKALRIENVNEYVRATDCIEEIKSQVRRLLAKGYGYRLKDGIYYDISKFKEYGKLARRTKEQAEDAVSRIDKSINKKNEGDFCLWKLSKPGELSWHSSWGKGRPGWHIEDTAITEKFFGPQYDIHGGALELIFPHHEAEVAQMEALSGKTPMVKYWIHTGVLTIEGTKMSKSLHNFITIPEFLKKHHPAVLWIFALSSHYRSPIDYNKEVIKEAEKNFEEISNFIKKIDFIRKNPLQKVEKTKKTVLPYSQLEKAMDDDFNTPKVLSIVFNFINKTSADLANFTREEANEIYQFLLYLDKVFKILPEKKSYSVPKLVMDLVKKREVLRKEKKWMEADNLRKEIKEKGFSVEDTKNGPILF